jgi:hypothetical protein
LWLFLFLGIGLLSLGVFWLICGLDGGFGSDVLLNVGGFAVVAGFSIILIAIYYFKLARTSTRKRARLLRSSKTSMVVGIIVTATFVAGMLLYWIPGYGWRIGKEILAEEPPKVSFEGLRDSYNAGEGLEFTVKLEGYWNDCGIFPDTEVLKSRDGGNSYDELIWLDRGTVNDYGNPDCDDNADRISKTRHIAGNPLKPLVLSEDGLYEVKSGGDNVRGAIHNFVVID